MMGYGLGYASKQKAIEARSAMGADHNQVGAPGLSMIEDYVSRVIFLDLKCHLLASRVKLLCGSRQRLIGEFSLLYPHGDEVGDCRLPPCQYS